MSDRDDAPKRVITVPGASGPAPLPPDDFDGDGDEGLVAPADLGSASRSCLAILVTLLIIALLLCIFIAAQPFLD